MYMYNVIICNHKEEFLKGKTNSFWFSKAPLVITQSEQGNILLTLNNSEINMSTKLQEVGDLR